MARAGYRIVDEPEPGSWAHLSVSPLIPMFAVMLAGNWLGLPWFVFNGFAFGSATRRKEAILAITGFLGSAVVLWGLAAFHHLDFTRFQEGLFEGFRHENAGIITG